jgi:hypothetical protein
MNQIRENMLQVSYTELGKPEGKGYYALPDNKGEVMLDEADVRYIREYLGKGFEPSFFVKPSPALRNAYIVVARQRL